MKYFIQSRIKNERKISKNIEIPLISWYNCCDNVLTKINLQQGGF
jgi:hypothetical protein